MKGKLEPGSKARVENRRDVGARQCFEGVRSKVAESGLARPVRPGSGIA